MGFRWSLPRLFCRRACATRAGGEVLALACALPLLAFPALAAETANPAKEKTNPKDGYQLVFIPAGDFWMGSADNDGSPEGSEPNEDEKPRHKVFLDGYHIGKYEVTVAQYARFCKETGREFRDQPSPEGPDHPNPIESAAQGPDHPVVNVNWEDARAYAEWAGMRLPTEAEWERAARGGTETRFWWGNEGDHAKANFDSQGSTPVGSFPANPFGLFDTAGNVWEWVADWYSETYYAESPYKNPQGPPSGETRVHKGGAWSNYPYYLRPALRYSSAPTRWSKLMGFRCAAK